MINYTRVITDEEQKILENDLLDVVDWINKAIEGKINNCLKRAALQFDQFAKQENMDIYNKLCENYEIKFGKKL